MADHAKFIGHHLDPSERKLVDQAREFSHDFDQLVFQAIDLDSMRPQSETVPILDQFLDQNRVSVVSLRDFKKTARDLIEACRIKSNIHPLLADHTFREAERFLEIIDMFESHLTGSKQYMNPALQPFPGKLFCLYKYIKNDKPPNFFGGLSLL